MVGLLGPNGAGKTTVINMAMGLTRPDAGEISLFGMLGGAFRPSMRTRVGFLQEKPSVYPEMSARTYLSLFASLYGVPDPRRRVAELIDAMSLTHAAGRALSTYSRGMQQRTCLARVMLHRPEFFVLDEPTLGLDPNGFSEMRDTILRLNAAGAAFLICSHQLTEMERICDRVILMNDGRVIVTGTKEDLARRLMGSVEVDVELAEINDAVADSLRGLPGVADVAPFGPQRLRVRLGNAQERDQLAIRSALSGAVARAGGTVLSVVTQSLTLEETFLEMTRTKH